MRLLANCRDDFNVLDINQNQNQYDDSSISSFGNKVDELCLIGN